MLFCLSSICTCIHIHLWERSMSILHFRLTKNIYVCLKIVWRFYMCQRIHHSKKKSYIWACNPLQVRPISSDLVAHFISVWLLWFPSMTSATSWETQAWKNAWHWCSMTTPGTERWQFSCRKFLTERRRNATQPWETCVSFSIDWDLSPLCFMSHVVLKYQLITLETIEHTGIISDSRKKIQIRKTSAHQRFCPSSLVFKSLILTTRDKPIFPTEQLSKIH